MFRKNSTIQINEQIAAASQAFVKIATAPVVLSKEEADGVFKGIEKIKSMGRDEVENLAGVSVKQFLKSTEDGDVKIAVRTMAKALGVINDAIHGKAYANDVISGVANKQFANKEFHTNRGVDLTRAVADIDVLNTALSQSDVDAGYMLAYTSMDLRGYEEGKVTDLLGQVRFTELDPEEEPQLTPMSSMQSTTFGHKKVGGGFATDSWSMQHSLLSVNMFLAALRLASLRMRAHIGYKELCIHDTDNLNQKLIAKHEAGAGDNQAQLLYWIALANARHTINEACRKMIETAAQIRDDVTKKGEDGKKISPLPVSMRTPFLFYYNFKHAEFISDIVGLGINHNGIPSDLEYDVRFIGSHMVPKSGAWKLGDTEKKDAEGAKGLVKEIGTSNIVAGRLVIPKNRNYFVTNQDLEFGSETSFIKQKTSVAAVERYNFVIDQRQAATVTLK